MIPEYVKDKTDLFSEEKYQLKETGGSVLLEEKKKEGRAKITCNCNFPFLVIKDPEKNVLPYLDGGKKGATSCPDKFIFVWDDEEVSLHIMEFKKTLDTQNLAKSKHQFMMGVYNARSLAAFLGISVGSVVLHSAFRRDGIEAGDGGEMIALRAANNPDALSLIQEWKAGECRLEMDRVMQNFPLRRVYLDAEGNGTLELQSFAEVM